MPRGRVRTVKENKENDSSLANEEQAPEEQVQSCEESEQITDKMQKISLSDDKRKGVKFATKKKTKEATTDSSERKRKNQKPKSKKPQSDEASDDEVVANVHIYDVDDAPACNIYDVASDSQSQHDDRPRPSAHIKRVDIVQQPVVSSSPVKQAFALFDWGEEKIKETFDTKKLRNQELISALAERDLSTEGTRQQKIQRLEDYLINHEGYQPSPKKETPKLNIQINFDDDEPSSFFGFGFRSTDTISDAPLDKKPVVKATYSRRGAAKPEPKPEPVKQAPAVKATTQKKKK